MKFSAEVIALRVTGVCNQTERVFEIRRRFLRMPSAHAQVDAGVSMATDLDDMDDRSICLILRSRCYSYVRMI